ncbi:hypothetical protein [Sphaerisporangium rubeum]|uniref:Uncharacterized protein n=1 Tax=Sphaerisporangium rubeum TaxID=321317 RepID=A0A7X0I9B6_9ACTN|nr:hypothetical protein [Sphaerisporangium rubeum]
MTAPGDQVPAVVVRVIRMARFAAGARYGRRLVIGGLIAAGWLLALFFGLGAAPAVAAAVGDHIPGGHVGSFAAGAAGHTAGAAEAGVPLSAVFSTSHVATGPVSAGDFPTVSDIFPADAGAIAGRMVDGLTSQSTPAPSSPSTADHSAGVNGFVPRNGGSGLSGLGLGDVARSVVVPGPMVTRVGQTRADVPIVRSVVDDPSFSPD